MREGLDRIKRGTRNIAQNLHQVYTTRKFEGLGFNPGIFEKFKELQLNGEEGTVLDLLKSPQGLAIMTRLIDFHQRNRRRRTRGERIFGTGMVEKDLEALLLNTVLKEKTNSSWLPALEELAKAHHGTIVRYKGMDVIGHFLAHADKHNVLNPAEARWFAQGLRSGDSFLMNRAFPYPARNELWERLILREIAASDENQPNLPTYVANAMHKAFSKSGHIDECVNIALASLDTKVAREGSNPTEVVTKTARDLLEMGTRKEGWWTSTYLGNWTPIACAGVSSSWSKKHFNGDPKTLFPVDVIALVNLLPQQQWAFVYNMLPLYMNDANVRHPFEPSRFSDIIAQAGKLAELSGGAHGTVDFMKRLGKLSYIDDENGMIRFIKRYVGDDRKKWRALATLSEAPAYMDSCIEYFFKSKPKSLVSLAENLRTAHIFDIEPPPWVRPLLVPFSVLSKEEQDRAIAPNKDDSTSLENAYRRMFESRMRTGGMAEDKIIDSVNASALNLRSKIARIRGAKEDSVRDVVVKEVSLQIANEAFDFFSHQLETSIRKKAKEIFGAEVTDKHADHPAFIDALAMTVRLQKKDSYAVNKDIALELMRRFLKGETQTVERDGYPQNRQENRRWLEKRLSPEARAAWSADMRKEYMLSGLTPLQDNVQIRIRNFLDVAAQIVPTIPVAFRPSPSEIAALELFERWFSGIDAKKNADSVWYKDMRVQIEGIRQASNSVLKKGHMPKKLVFEKERDPMRSLMMGTWVSGSCLDASEFNAWSVFTNACEINKGVIWIKDERGGILGRVLIAIDRNKGLVRFPVYYTSYGLNLDTYVNTYLKDIASDLELTTAGKMDDVELLFCGGWYKDPQVTISQETEEDEIHR
ncbi:hypothetical protein HY968_02410 [Candidatus Kaiserbacteria bacterium]|nr:hypothetical protein [Candidatus Kaiserbacteria bacterium]